MDRVAIILVNYNMPERTDALCDCIVDHVKWPHSLIVVDNGSDLCRPSRYTTLRIIGNRQTTGGWLAGLKEADRLVKIHDEPYFAYWFLITSAEFPEGQNIDPLTPLVEALQTIPEAVGIHPALTGDSTTAWQQLLTRGGDQPRRTWMIDNIASLYRADWLDSIGRFDPELIYAWGIDYETCWFARKHGKGLYVHEGVKMRKISNIGYAMNRMNMSADERGQRAGANMADVLSKKYGPNWFARMREEYITNDMV